MVRIFIATAADKTVVENPLHGASGIHDKQPRLRVGDYVFVLNGYETAGYAEMVLEELAVVIASVNV